MLRGVPETPAKLQSGGGVNSVVSGPRMGRVLYTVTTLCAGVGVVIATGWAVLIDCGGRLKLGNVRAKTGREKIRGKENEDVHGLGKTGGVLKRHSELTQRIHLLYRPLAGVPHKHISASALRDVPSCIYFVLTVLLADMPSFNGQRVSSCAASKGGHHWLTGRPENARPTEKRVAHVCNLQRTCLPRGRVGLASTQTVFYSHCISAEVPQEDKCNTLHPPNIIRAPFTDTTLKINADGDHSCVR